MQHFIVIARSEIRCNFGISADGTMLYHGNPVNPRIIVASETSFNGRTTSTTSIHARSLVIYPSSNTGRYFFVRACEKDSGEGLCWTYFIFDSVGIHLTETFIEKYGPTRWIKWSADDRYAILVYRSEGVTLLYAIDTLSGKPFVYPRLRADIDVDEKTFNWRGLRSFRLKVLKCAHCAGTSIDANGRMRDFDITPNGIASRS
jgi:hypothetical protein